MTQIIGLTGGIASGKSTVSKFFVDEGIPVIDTDQIAHDLLDKGTSVYDEIIHHFSKDILLTDHSINRKKLGQIIFANKGMRDLLNSIVHPQVYKMVDLELERYTELETPFVVVDVPLLYETGFEAQCDAVIVVYTSFEQQISRLVSRDMIDEDYAKMKINAQMPLAEKAAKATYVIDNSFSILETKKAFLEILQKLEVK